MSSFDGMERLADQTSSSNPWTLVALVMSLSPRARFHMFFPSRFHPILEITPLPAPVQPRLRDMVVEVSCSFTSGHKPSSTTSTTSRPSSRCWCSKPPDQHPKFWDAEIVWHRSVAFNGRQQIISTEKVHKNAKNMCQQTIWTNHLILWTWDAFCCIYPSSSDFLMVVSSATMLAIEVSHRVKTIRRPNDAVFWVQMLISTVSLYLNHIHIISNHYISI